MKEPCKICEGTPKTTKGCPNEEAKKRPDYKEGDLKGRACTFRDFLNNEVPCHVSQQAFIEAMLQKFNLQHVKPANAPHRSGLAIDRVDDEVNYLYDPYNNAVLNLIKNVIESGIKQKIQVSLCGEMAGDIQFTRLLLGMGLKSFSMHPSAIPEVKEIILKTDIRSLEKLSSRIINCVDSKEKHELIKKLNQMTKR